jgi:hypothetical protein
MTTGTVQGTRGDYLPDKLSSPKTLSTVAKGEEVEQPWTKIVWKLPEGGVPEGRNVI